jgi:hypothetical protein
MSDAVESTAVGTIVLLCDFDQAGQFVDRSLSFHALAGEGTTAVSTAQAQFGVSSLFVSTTNVTASRVYQTDTKVADWQFGGNPFTIECWVYLTAAPGSSTQGFVTQFGFNTNLGWFLGSVGGQLAFYYSTNGADNPSIGANWTPTLNTWHHIAVDRDATNTIRVYLDGAVVATGSISGSLFSSTQAMNIGNDNNRNRAVTGYIDEVRITKGAAQYGGAFTPPSSPFPIPTITYTTWNPSDLVAVTLSGTNNNTASRSGSGAGGVRTIDHLGSGKLYFEYLCTTWPNSSAVGVANAAASLTQWGANAVNACVVYATTGNIWLGTAYTGFSLGTRANGDLIGVALDLDDNMIWFRAGAAGNWNGSPSANPATNSGGISIGSIASGIALYGVFGHVGATAVITGNFGDTAFTGALPAGFTSGFWAGQTSPTNELITEVVVEEWAASSTPAMQLTEVVVEEWAPVIPTALQSTQVGLEQWGNAVPPVLLSTQVALEHWASVALGPPPALRSTQVAVEQWMSVATIASIQPVAGRSYALSAGRAGVTSAIVQQTTTLTYAVGLPAILDEASTVPPAFVSPTGPAYVISAGRGGLTSVIVQQTTTLSYALTPPAILAEAPIAPSTGAPTTTVHLVGVAATGVAGVVVVRIPRLALVTGVFATGHAGSIQAYAGPAVFVPGVYAIGVAEPVFALAGGVVEKFTFFMGGVF